MLMTPYFMNNPIAHYFKYFVGGYFELVTLNVIVFIKVIFKIFFFWVGDIFDPRLTKVG
jgi:hypothetical protein